jgi:hypothetical protein
MQAEEMQPKASEDSFVDRRFRSDEPEADSVSAKVNPAVSNAEAMRI